jgi:hypothetical protein
MACPVRMPDLAHIAASGKATIETRPANTCKALGAVTKPQLSLCSAREIGESGNSSLVSRWEGITEPQLKCREVDLREQT